MRKRERENPCCVCNHYHKEGEICQVCGHSPQGELGKCGHYRAFSDEILPFLFLGSYDNASRSELLKTQGISHILNTVARCQNLYKNSFNYFTLKDESLPLEECITFIEDCRRQNSKVLVHCMSGMSRSPAVVIAYLMRHKGWPLAQCHDWVKERRPSIMLSADMLELLQQFEKRTPADQTPAFPCFNPPDVSLPVFNHSLPIPGAGDDSMHGA